MKIYIITGTTNGIGRALADAVVSAGEHLLSLSRAADKTEPNRHNIQCDLRHTERIGESLERLLATVQLDQATELILINNAGVLEPIGPIDQLSTDGIINHLHVNQAAPAVLMSEFIRLTRGQSSERRIINISSGAAKHPYAGWSVYCASKAALDMMTMCVAKEQERRNNPVKVCAVYPGRVETRMQYQIRHTETAKFPAKPDFVKAKKLGKLLSAKEAAEMILALDNAGELKSGGLYDLREAFTVIRKP